MKRILLASSLLLFSCEKQQPQPTTCECYEEQYNREVSSTYQIVWVYDRNGLPFTDFCINDGKEREVGNKKYVQVCQ